MKTPTEITQPPHDTNLTIGELDVRIVRKGIKNLHLSVEPPDGWVRVAAPERLSDESVRLYVLSKLGWIRRQQAQFAQQARQTPRQYVDRESHYVRGERYLLRVIPHAGAGWAEVKNNGYLDLHVRPESTTEQRHRVMQEWYREQLRHDAAPLVATWCERMHLEGIAWEIKQMHTKWGTCNEAARRIWLNLELAKKPLPCLEYVIVHELIHFQERHHNERFRALLDDYLPGWRREREELNRFIL